ncbi:GNAT family N-acetyltransferase [Sphingomonas glaciei]|uniref:GNAT family N-acetyltransferase n=1 Tax=Sphingomonas glaciei TaxID=2938948 RepID=A0ABY5MUC2_9SPHN|nr:GNAT family N-acetyltransferase [Sphingomonas glaciei]UUR07574.1 GNAT family N-acetyltransferase [Sphingomonas glaciei]
MSDYAIEELTPGHFDELRPLMEDAFGSAVPADLFKWKYLQNPSGPAIGRVARATDGSLAAFYGMIPEGYRLGGEDRLIYQSCDTMTHSAHRRKGLFQKLALQTYAAAEEKDPNFFAFGFSGDMSTPGFLKMGWRVEEELSHFFRPYPLTLLDSFGGSEAAETPVSDGALLDTMAALAPPDDGIVRDRAFLEWRLANPLHHYRALLLHGQSYAIFYREGALLFLLDFAERAPGVGRPILRRLSLLSRGRGGKGVLTWATTHSAMARSLKSAGYVTNPFRRGPGSHRIPLISYGNHPGGTWMKDLAISPFHHDSL